MGWCILQSWCVNFAVVVVQYILVLAAAWRPHSGSVKLIAELMCEFCFGCLIDHCVFWGDVISTFLAPDRKHYLV